MHTHSLAQTENGFWFCLNGWNIFAYGKGICAPAITVPNNAFAVVFSIKIWNDFRVTHWCVYMEDAIDSCSSKCVNTRSYEAPVYELRRTNTQKKWIHLSKICSTMWIIYWKCVFIVYAKFLNILSCNLKIQLG